MGADRMNTEKMTTDVTRRESGGVVADGHPVPIALIVRSVPTAITDRSWGSQLRSSQHPVERAQQDYDPG